MSQNPAPRNLPTRWLLLALASALALAPSAWSQVKEPTPAEAAAAAKAQADAEAARTAPVTATGATQSKPDETMVLSPFVVTTSKDSGYFAENTLAGSRLNTNLADLAASITVVTKQQMEDTASIDINDVFKYEANTEGSSTYSPVITDRGTMKDSVAGYTLGNDGSTTTNAQSNRVRGLSAPDASINYYPSNSRIPFDSYNTQSVEISRGPNSLLFGLGSPAGIVNQSASQAVLNRNTNSVSVRTDNVGSFRTTLALNRSLIDDKLAVFVAFLYNNQQFERKPSYDLFRRQYAAVTYKPFKRTVIRAFAENYQNDANRPNFLTPRDQVTPWYQAGRPAYDPIARTITRLDTGQVYGPYYFDTRSPGYNAAITTLNGTALLTNTASPRYVEGIFFDDVGRPLRRIDGGETVDMFQRQPQFFRPAHTNPATALPSATSLGWTTNDARFAILDRQWTSSGNLPNPTTVLDGNTYTFGNYQWGGIIDSSIYDWTRYNTNQANFGRTKAGNYNIELEQQVFDNLFFSAGWFRQQIDSAENYTISQLTGATVGIDTNLKMINGAPNPYFGLPFISEGTGGGLDTFYSPETDDNFRAMLAYDLDFTPRNGWTRWLGKHRLLGMMSSQKVVRDIERWRMNFVDGDTEGILRYRANLVIPNTNLSLSTATKRHFYLASPGDAQGVISQSTGMYGNKGWETPLTSNVEVYDFAAGAFKNVQVVERTVFSQAGSYKSQREVKSWNLALQSYLWEDRLVSTLGWRHDDYRARRTTDGALTDINGAVVTPALTVAELYANGVSGEIDYERVMNRWNRWDELDGDTKTLGAAFRPFKGVAGIERRANGGSILADFVRGLTFYYNQSDNFNPPSVFATDFFRRPLPKPSGNGKDGGFGFSLLNNKLVARLNWFETENINERTSAANTILTRAQYSDTTTGIPWARAVVRIRHGADTSVTNWNTDAVNSVAAYENEVWALLNLPVNYYSGISTGATQQSKAKGMELQVTYNPSNNWTMKFTGGKQETVYTGVAPEFDAWIAERMPSWTTQSAPEIADFTDGSGRRYSLRNFWTGYGFTNVAQIENTDGNTSPQAYYENVVVSQVGLAKALEGTVAPNQRIYRASFLTNYSFTSGRFRGFSVGGSERWESKAAAGFYGKAADPTRPTVLTAADPTRPVYLDNGNFYTDLWVSYTRKIYSDKIRMKIQLNINNALEDGRLLPLAVNYDGKPWSYRIIDPRQFILTTSFDF